MLTMLTRTILTSTLLLSTAYAQPAPSAAETRTLVAAPIPLPVPVNGCVWAGRSFSDGAGFCLADKVMQTCAAGKWVREGASEGCHGALADTK